MSHLLTIHDLAGLADHYFGQIASVAFCARMTAREMDHSGHQALLEAIESLSVLARQAIEDQCADQEAIAQQMAQGGAK